MRQNRQARLIYNLTLFFGLSYSFAYLRLLIKSFLHELFKFFLVPDIVKQFVMQNEIRRTPCPSQLTKYLQSSFFISFKCANACVVIAKRIISAFEFFEGQPDFLICFPSLP